jgi:uncharacterized membrane protein
MESGRPIDKQTIRPPERPGSRNMLGARAWFRPDSSTIIAIVVALIAAVGIIVTLASASRLPELRLTTVGITVDRIAPGESFQVTDQIDSDGAVASPLTATELCLSRNQSRSKACLPLTGSRTIPPLSPGRQSSDQSVVTVPVGTVPGTYFVIECVGTVSPYSETNIRNNCRSSSTALIVTEK